MAPRNRRSEGRDCKEVRKLLFVELDQLLLNRLRISRRLLDRTQDELFVSSSMLAYILHTLEDLENLTLRYLAASKVESGDDI